MRHSRYNHFMTIAVRAAVPTDIGWLLGELAQFAKFTGIAHGQIKDNERTRGRLLDLISRHYFIVADEVLEHCTTPVGFIAAYEQEHPFFEGTRWLAEVFWWVTPEARHSRAGAMLFNEYLKYAHSRPDLDTQVSIALEELSPIKPASLEKRGFKLVERSFIKTIPRAVA